MTTGSHRLRPAVKDKPSHVVQVKICLWKTGGCLLTLSKTITRLSSGLSNEKVPNVASANETGNPEDE
ncbi:hypothetical protein [Coleofasciculus chthonoplastes]|uniref:hypothetical protein n=1 Tax=Coleofasciculus chthonoplastes TaxID=64178 RepID=UPI0040644AC2